MEEPEVQKENLNTTHIENFNQTWMSMHIVRWSGVSVASTMWTLPIYIFPTTIVIFTNIRANLEVRGRRGRHT